jgi:hypothetical protein
MVIKLSINQGIAEVDCQHDRVSSWYDIDRVLRQKLPPFARWEFKLTSPREQRKRIWIGTLSALYSDGDLSPDV